MTQGGKQPHPQQRDQHGADAADQCGRHRAEQSRDHAAFEVAELVGGIDEQEVHCTNPAAHRVGGGELHQREADHHAHRIGGAHRGQRQQRQPQPVRQREHDGAETEGDHRLEHAHADAALDGMAREHECHQKRADRRRAAQHAEAPRSSVQDVARIDRQQRGGAAKQYGEQIERDGAENGRVATHEAHAVEPVSYTHLELYKRQPSNSALRVGGSFASIRRAIPIAPVSEAATSQNAAMMA